MNKYIQADQEALMPLGLGDMIVTIMLCGWILESRDGLVRIDHSCPDVVWLMQRSCSKSSFDSIKFASMDALVYYLSLTMGFDKYHSQARLELN